MSRVGNVVVGRQAYSHLQEDDAQRIVGGALGALHELSNSQFRACGACGLRSPGARYSQPKRLAVLPEGHWLVVPPDALAALDAYRPGGTDSVELRSAEGVRVEVRRSDFHTVTRSGGRTYHVAQESVTPAGEVALGEFEPLMRRSKAPLPATHPLRPTPSTHHRSRIRC